MPAYTCEKIISRAIDSILSQTHQNIELLISDDLSTDNTRKIIDSYDDRRIKSFHNQENLGYLKTCNKLFEECEGDYIAFQDADDWSHPSRIEKQLEAFKNDPGLGICGTWAKYYTGDEIETGRCYRPVSSDSSIRKKIGFRNQFCGASIMIRKDVYAYVGGYDLFFDRIGNEDYYWSYLITEKYKAYNIEEELYNIRLSPMSITRNVKNRLQLLSAEIVSFLIEKRQSGEFSSKVIDSSAEFLISYLEHIETPYIRDPSLIFRKEADIKVYNEDIKGACYSAFKGVSKRPFKLINWKYFASLVKRLMFNNGK